MAKKADNEITVRDMEREIEAARDLMLTVRELVGDVAEDDEYVRDTFEGETTLDDAIRRTLLANIEDEIRVTGLSAQIAKLTERKRRYENRIDIRVSLIERAMLVAEWQKKEFDIATVSLAKAPDSIKIDEEAVIPAEYWRRGDPVLNKAALREKATSYHKALTEASKVADMAARASALQAVLSTFPSDAERDDAITDAILRHNDPEALCIALQHIATHWPPIPGCHLDIGGKVLRIRK